MQAESPGTTWKGGRKKRRKTEKEWENKIQLLKKMVLHPLDVILTIQSIGLLICVQGKVVTAFKQESFERRNTTIFLLEKEKLNS